MYIIYQACVSRDSVHHDIGHLGLTGRISTLPASTTTRSETAFMLKTAACG